MKKLVSILLLLASLNLSAGDMIRTWECNGTIVTYNFDKNTMSVGDLIYYAYWPNDNEMLLLYAGAEMFRVFKDGSGGLIFTYQVNGEKFSRHFIKCD